MDLRSPLDYSLDRNEREPVSEALQQPGQTREPLDRDVDVECPSAAADPRRLPNAPKRDVARSDGRSKSDGASPRIYIRRSISPDSRRPKRSEQVEQVIGLQLRPEERLLLQEVGKFRVIATRDLAEFLYGDDEKRLIGDLKFLQANRLIDVHVLNARRDNPLRPPQKFEAVTLTHSGRQVLIETGEIRPEQQVYSGLVKAREAEHDSQVYRAYRRELNEITKRGGSNPRVRLDFELKQQVNRAVFVARKSQRERDEEAIKTEVGQQFDIKVVNRKLVVPDLRIEYDMPNGASDHVDVEVATAAYRHGHLATKARAGFKLYASPNDIGRLGAAVQDDHDIMSEILSL
jgi:hypothetical protein